MKAKEYARQYKRDKKLYGDNKAIVNLMSAIYAEMGKVMEQRKVQSDSACFAVLDEFDDKWQAFCRLMPEFRPDGFRDFAGERMPEVCKLWLEYKEHIRKQVAWRRRGR